MYFILQSQCPKIKSGITGDKYCKIYTSKNILSNINSEDDVIISIIVQSDAKIKLSENGWSSNYYIISDKIIISDDRYNLYDTDPTILLRKFDLDVMYIKRVIQHGNLKLLEVLKSLNLISVCTTVMFEASWYGHANILEWWKNSGLPLNYDCDEIDYASSYGRVNVLEWWKNSGLSLEYTEDALDDIPIRCDKAIDVLEWWKHSGLELKYSEKALLNASWARGGRIDVLDWWKNSGLILKLKYRADMSLYCENVIKWWENSEKYIHSKSPPDYEYKYMYV